MRKKHIHILFLVIYSTAVFGQINNSFEEFLEEGLDVIINEFDAVGISIAVIAGDEEWAGAGGISSEEDSLNTRHVLALGSITKPIVSACILGLMEEDRLKLSDPIHLYLEDREHIDSTITIKELLYHTSGVFDYTTHPTFFDTLFQYDSKVFNVEEVLDTFLLEPVFSRGVKQEYSNTNYLLLGMIIEQITGRPYYEEVIARFNLEQDYPSVSVVPYLQEPNDLAHLWFDIGFGQIDFQEVGISLNSLFSSATSAGAFVSTPMDLAKFGRDLLSGQLLGEAAMDSFYLYHPYQLSGQVDYGLGVVRSNTYCGVPL